MVALQNKKVCSELFELLKHTDREDLYDVPTELLRQIKNNRDEEYVPNIDEDNFYNSLSKEAYSMYVWIYMSYICKDENEKKNINSILYKNEQNLNSNFASDALEKDRKIDEVKNTNDNENMEMICYKEGIFKKIFTKFKNFFK